MDVVGVAGAGGRGGVAGANGRGAWLELMEKTMVFQSILMK